MAKDTLTNLCKLDMQGADSADIKRCNANVLSLHRAQIFHAYSQNEDKFYGVLKLRSADLGSLLPDSEVEEEEEAAVNDLIDSTVQKEVFEVDARVVNNGNVENIGDNGELELELEFEDSGNEENNNDEDADVDIFTDTMVTTDEGDENIPNFILNQGRVFAEKDMDCRNPFRLLGLAIRHNAILEARSSLFLHEELSYTREELNQNFPKLVIAKLGDSVAAKSNSHTNNLNYDLECEINRLRR